MLKSIPIALSHAPIFDEAAIPEMVPADARFGSIIASIPSGDDVLASALQEAPRSASEIAPDADAIKEHHVPPSIQATKSVRSFDELRIQIEAVRPAIAEHRPEIDGFNPASFGPTLYVGGTPGDDILIGNTGNDTLDGGAGADTMSGGLGNDTYYVDSTGDVVSENANEEYDIVFASVSYTLSDNVENLTLTGDAVSSTGNSLDNYLAGNSGNNVLDGADGSDMLEGRAGDDTMVGGLGRDFYTVDSVGDVVSEHANEGTDTVISFAASYTLSDNVENLTLAGDAVSGTGNSLANYLTGNSLDNILDGSVGNDTFEGGCGSDTMIGGLGDDTFYLESTDDIVTENANEGHDTVHSSAASYTLGADVEDLTLLDGSAVNGTGNSLDNRITGNSLNNILDGGAGADTMVGGLGDDAYFVDHIGDVVSEYANEGTDTVHSSAASYTLDATVELLYLIDNALDGTGNSLNNELYGNSDSNVLDGGAGADTMVGGLGDDGYYVDSIGDVVNENANEGTDAVYASFSYTLGDDLEQLYLTGDALLGTGNGLANWIEGTSGNNGLDGGAGRDTMVGGLGDDTYTVESASDLVLEYANEGTDTVHSSALSYTLSTDVENLTLTGGAVSGTGNSLDNQLTGNSNSNVLDGGAGADTMVGGLGDDVYYVDHIGDVVSENAREGTDTIYSSVNHTLGGSTHVENLTLTGSALNGTGNSLDNLIVGNSAGNSLDGGAGGDEMRGGLGNDNYRVDNDGDRVAENANEGTDTVYASVSHTLAANVENLTLTGGAADGNGNSLANRIEGNSLNNVLDGGAGNDTMAGSLGNDTYYVDSALFLDSTGDVVTEYANEGTDTVYASVNHTLAANVENLTLTNDAYLGKGNSLNNEVIGTNGHNFLDGGAGADTMSGARGNDIYVVDNIGDLVIEAANNGIDIVNTSVSYALGDNVENLTLTGGGAINGTGNSLANEITGNSGNNVLDGGAGADTMTGNFGNDTYRVDNTGDVVIEAAGQGTDTVSSSITTYTLGGNVENLTLVGFAIEGFGNSLDNRITGNGSSNALIGGFGNDFLDGDFGHDNLDGGDGNDTIIGGFGDDSIFGSFGNDTLDGGGGSDYFIFDVRNTGTDVVTEFVVGEDKIVLGNFDPSTDGLTYNSTTGQLFYDADRDGLDVVQIALISNLPSLSSSDFIVVI